MPRSAGVTASAVIVLIGSAFTVLVGVMMLLASALMSKSIQAPNVPVHLGSVLGIESVIIFAFGGWGLATGIGLIYLKQWARISTLVYAAILLFISLPVAVLLAVIHLSNSSDPNLPSNFATTMRVGMILFYAMFAALGGLWLYFFNRQDVKAQFQGDPQALASPTAEQTDTRPSRPLSITIIGWFLVVSSALAPLSLLMFSASFSGGHLPLYFLGFFFFGRIASLILIVWMAAQMVAAVGLLKLKNWARLAAIGLQCLAVINAALLVIPANRARFQVVMETMITSMNVHMPRPNPVGFPVWAGFAMSLPIVFVILWFLMTEKHTFTSTAQETPHPH